METMAEASEAQTKLAQKDMEISKAKFELVKQRLH